MDQRPQFIDLLSAAHADEAKNVVNLTGNVQDLYWLPGSSKFLPLEQVLYDQLKRGYTVLRFDVSSGISAFTDADEAELLRVVKLGNVSALECEKLPDGDSLRNEMRGTSRKPIEAITLLRRIEESFRRAARDKDAKVKPLCVITQYSGAIFSAGDWDRLGEEAKQRLVSFLSWISNPGFVDSDNLVILVSSTNAELNARIFECPTTSWIQIPLPNETERKFYIDRFLEVSKKEVKFALPKEQFYSLSTGLQIVHLQALLEGSARSGREITRALVVDRVKDAFKKFLGDTVEIKRPEHGPEAIICYDEHKARIASICARFSDRSTAPPVILASGPNGVGKTFLWEAYSGSSGFVVIVLKSIRSMWYGETDKLVEKLRFVIETFGKCLIFIDEAHTQFSSIHSEHTQDVEKRLNASFIMMMSDKTLLGKAVWVLMTSRPDKLDPDIKSRSQIQIPIFDLEAEERRKFVAELLKREGFPQTDEDLEKILQATENYSNRDYSYLVTEARGAKRTILETLDDWRAATSIQRERRCQALIAARHCSYPKLVPDAIESLGQEGIEQEIEQLRLLLRW